MISRRCVLQVSAFAALAPYRAHGASTASRGARIILLGTAGGPPPHAGRSQPASLLEVDGKRYLIDAGENVGQQLVRAGISPAEVDLTLLTHLHWDHTLGLDYLMAGGWMMGRVRPMPIWGPPGTRKLVDATKAGVAIGEDIFRPQVPGRPALASLYPVREFDVTTPQILLEEGGIRISAVANTHFARIHGVPHDYGMDKSYSYRFDTPYGSAVFTGDTGPSDPLAAFCHGADTLVSEVVDLASIRAGLVAAGTQGAALDALMQHMEFQHLTPERLALLARDAGVKTLVLTHFVAGRDADPQSMIAPLRRHFTGSIVLGQDMSVTPLGT